MYLPKVTASGKPSGTATTMTVTVVIRICMIWETMSEGTDDKFPVA